MDINSVLILQEEQELASARLNETGDNSTQAASADTNLKMASLSFLSTAASQAHSIASIMPEKAATVAPTTPPQNSAPQHNIANVGGTGPGNNWTNNFPPPSGDQNSPQGPTSDPSVPPNPWNIGGDGNPGYLNKLYDFIYNMSQDPDDMAQGQIFLQYLENLSAAGLLSPGSQCDQMLQQMDGNMSIQQLISNLILQNAALAYFEGFGGNAPGNASASAWIMQQANILSNLGQGNQYVSQMLADLSIVGQQFQGTTPGSSVFDKTHYNAKTGQYYFISPVTGYEAIWTPGQNTTLTGDNLVIYSIISSSDVSKTPGSFWDNFNSNSFARNYRMQVFDMLFNSYKNDPSLILTLFIMMTTSDQCDSQLTGATDQTDRQTLVTNLMTPITNLAGSIGTLTPAQVDSFVTQLNQVTSLVNSMHSTESYASTFTSSVYESFMNISVTFKTAETPSQTYTATLSQVFNNSIPGVTLTQADQANAVNAINPGVANPPGSPPSQLQNYLNALQQGNSLVSQQSKTISTESASISNLLDQVLKVMNFDLSGSGSGGGGYVALVSSVVQNQVSH